MIVKRIDNVSKIDAEQRRMTFSLFKPACHISELGKHGVER